MAADFPINSEEEGLVAKRRPGDNAEPLSVSEISNILKRTVEEAERLRPDRCPDLWGD